jgi:tripartite ATP-independent transporter DctP family solute receptor
MMSLSKRVGLLLGLLVCCVTHVNAAPRVLKAGIGLNADTPQGQAMSYFANLVEKKSGGRLTVELHSGGALGDDVSMVSALQAGKQDITCPDSSTLAKQVSDFSAINYPFTFLNEQEADGILDGEWGRRLLGKLPDKGLVGLAFWENGFRHLTNSKRPLPTLSATQGIRMRTMQNQMLIDTFGLLGFEPVPLPFTKVYSALSDQTVDGQENPLPTILSSRFYEVQKYLTLSRHVYSAFVLLIGKSTWDSLTPADQQAVSQAAAEARDMQRRTNRAATAAALEQLKAKGMQITSIDVRESERVRNKLRPVLEKYHRQIGERTVLSMYVELSQARAAQQLARSKPVQ